MKEVNQDLIPEVLGARLTTIADDTIKFIVFGKNIDYDNSFEKASDAFGLMYGVSKLFEKVNRQMALLQNGKAELSDESFLDSVKDTLGYSILLIDYIQRNSNSATPFVPVQSTPIIIEEPIALDTLPDASAENLGFRPDIPHTTEGIQPQDAH